MSFDSYTNLQAEITSRLKRSDLAARYPSFIALTEAKMQRALRDLQMEKRSTASISAEYIALPTDFLELRDIQLDVNTGNATLQMLSPSELDRRYSGHTGQPKAYCLVANQLQFGPSPDTTYTAEIIYLAKFVSLASVSTNWVLDNHPDVYYYGALFEAYAEEHDTEAASAYGQLFANALDQMQGFAKRQRWSGPPMRITAA